MEQAVAFMIGTTAVIVGLSLIFRATEWLGYIKQVRAQGTGAALMIGYMHIIIGTFVVGFHWKWAGLPLLLTLVGVKAILEGIVYTLFPRAMLAMLAWYEPRGRLLLRLTGLITIAIGLLILCEWREYMWPDCVTWTPCFNQATLMKE